VSGMPSITTRWGWRALLACGFAACLIAAHSTLPARAGDNNAENKNAENKNAPSSDAQAGDDDNNADDWIDTKIVKGILNGIGLKNTVEPGINYHERSPLVVPPTRDLPAPQVAAPQPNSAWPKDKDMTPRKVVTKKRESKPATEAEQEDMRQLRPDELRGPKAAKRTANAGPQSDPDGRSQQLMPNQLGFQGFNLNPTKWFDRGPDVVEFKEEPSRGTLTDPPAGLRTPSPKYTYGTKNALEPEKNGQHDIAVGAGVEK
jgi:hypothetical protein